jgi:Trypsin-like peptidase domain
MFDPTRAVEINIKNGDYGSGYRIGGRLVLTCAHIIKNEPVDCEVRSQPQGFEWKKAEVVWKKEDLDIALIELPQEITSLKPVTFGKRPKTVSADEFKFYMYGYPKWARDEGYAEGKTIEGTFNLSDSSIKGFLNLKIKDEWGLYVQLLKYLFSFIPRLRLIWGDASGQESIWGGASGSVVVCEELIIGVLLQHRNIFLPWSLQAQPLDMISDDPQWRDLMTENGINPDFQEIGLHKKNEATEDIDPQIEGKWFWAETGEFEDCFNSSFVATVSKEGYVTGRQNGNNIEGRWGWINESKGILFVDWNTGFIDRLKIDRMSMEGCNFPHNSLDILKVQRKNKSLVHEDNNPVGEWLWDERAFLATIHHDGTVTGKDRRELYRELYPNGTPGWIDIEGRWGWIDKKQGILFVDWESTSFFNRLKISLDGMSMEGTHKDYKVESNLSLLKSTSSEEFKNPTIEGENVEVALKEEDGKETKNHYKAAHVFCRCNGYKFASDFKVKVIDNTGAKQWDLEKKGYWKCDSCNYIFTSITCVK